jgi:hypothetical protein
MLSSFYPHAILMLSSFILVAFEEGQDHWSLRTAIHSENKPDKPKTGCGRAESKFIVREAYQQ